MPEKSSLLIDTLSDCVRDFERRSKPIEAVLYASFVVLLCIFVYSIVSSLRSGADLSSAFPVPAGALFLLYLVYLRMDIHRACLYDTYFLKMAVLTGGKEALLTAIRANSCRNISKALSAVFTQHGE